MGEANAEAAQRPEDIESRDGAVKVTVCPITGRQFWFLSIPSKFCEECDLTLSLVRRLAAELDERVEVEVKPWLRHMWSNLRRRAWHAPVVFVDGRIFSQGVVPDADALKARLLEVAAARREGTIR